MPGYTLLNLFANVAVLDSESEECVTDLGCLQEDHTSGRTEVPGTLVLVASDSTLLDFQIEICMCVLV